ncbi:methyltransferase [Streptomyces virginiae]|uniref:methyltransferase n=1 Tax=Streptomyces virginiae TaxID=1961 RepID=UPI00224F0961|nr:methyltransferase [Streptomyces virginiae]MCX4717894.1 methyltransferase [Streptomyces virginiae]MCX5277929.1 methyltransferase [Streptomyces virginiae]
MSSSSRQHDGTPMDALINLCDLVTPMALRVAATLRLTDHMLAGATAAKDLASATGTDPGALHRLVRHLAAVGVYHETSPGRFEPTDVGLLLADDHPVQQRHWLALDQPVGRADLAFTRLLDAVRTGRPSYEALYGRPFWEDLSAVPELGEAFDRLMATEEEAVHAAPIAAYDWSGVRHVLDLGGAPGGFLQSLVRAAPHLRGTVLDLPGPAGRTRERIAAAGTDSRIDVLGGDFFDELPVRADLVLLSMVLLNWQDDDARRILERCRDALEPGGRILLRERAEPAEGPEVSTSDRYFSVLDMRMLVFLGGRVRTTEEWRALAASAGLAVTSLVTPISSPVVPFDFCLIEMSPV